MSCWPCLTYCESCNLPPLTGSGSPEGVVTADPGRLYLDTDSAPHPVYLKVTGSGNTGWQIVPPSVG